MFLHFCLQAKLIIDKMSCQIVKGTGAAHNLLTTNDFHTPGLELEIDECLQVGGDELVHEKYGCYRYQEHYREREQGEADAVPALPLYGQQMDNQAYCHKCKYFPIIDADIRYQVHLPARSYLIDHIARAGPGLGICGSRIKVAAAAEEEAGECDEYESLKHAPDVSCPADPRLVCNSLSCRAESRVNETDKRAKA